MPDTEVTLWQRFWRSPWTWLAFWANTLYLIGWTHQSIGYTVVNWICFVIFGLRFFQCGDARWGKP